MTAQQGQLARLGVGSQPSTVPWGDRPPQPRCARATGVYVSGLHPAAQNRPDLPTFGGRHVRESQRRFHQLSGCRGGLPRRTEGGLARARSRAR